MYIECVCVCVWEWATETAFRAIRAQLMVEFIWMEMVEIAERTTTTTNTTTAKMPTIK